MNPFENLNPSPNKDQLIDKAFRKAMKYSYQPTRKISKKEIAKKDTKNKINLFSQILIDSLDSIILRFPSIDRIDPFYFELLDILFGIDKVKIALSSINGVIPVIRKITRETIKNLNRAQTISEITKTRKSVYGRIGSVINRIGNNLQFIRDVIFEVRKLPTVDPSLLTISVAGHPNVGKSTFVKTISSAEPEIADYPFTTKKIMIGHWEYEREIIQIMDVPGLLDRPIDEKNKIELQAIAVLKHIADIIIFLFDASETCGYPVDNQFALFQQIKQLFPDNLIIPVINKIDITDKNKVTFLIQKLGPLDMISSSNKEQVEVLLKKAINYIKS